jgi:hypothetical protein
MGLDQYAYTGKRRETNDETDYVEIAYWRKHNRLEGFMKELWIEKGRLGANELYPDDFNCIMIELTPADINRLDEATVNDTLRETFFFGPDSQGDDHKKQETLKFISRARDAFAADLKVFYSSNW